MNVLALIIYIVCIFALSKKLADLSLCGSIIPLTKSRGSSVKKIKQKNCQVHLFLSYIIV